MNKELIISAQSKEINIALLEDKELVELTKKKQSSKFAVGDIYLAKVKKVISGLNAVFVDLGYEKDAFLHYHDLGPQFSSLSKLLNQTLTSKGHHRSFSKFQRIPDIDKHGNISDVIQSGQHILVQVAKEPISTKGPRLSSEVSIAGRNVVLIPFSDKVSVSQKIASNEEKKRLKKLVQSIKPNNYGVIIRTVAIGKSVAELDEELRGLVNKWETSLKKVRRFKNETPKLILGEINNVTALLRDVLSSSFTNIVVDNKMVHQEIKSYIKNIAPDKEEIVKLFDSNVPIFEKFGIEKQIRGLFGKNVAVRNGAYLIIEHTEALHVIDVNSGNRTKFDKDQESNALDVNTSVAKEIARQLRLRDMGGIIVIDFIDMKSPENKSRLFEVMRNAMAPDRAKHNILPLSKFGLMQITRQRVKPELNIAINEVCPTCCGTGEISPSINLIDQIEDDLKHVCKTLNKKHVKLRTHPYIAGYLTKGLFPVVWKWKLKYGFGIKVESLSSFNYLEYSFYNKDNTKITL